MPEILPEDKSESPKKGQKNSPKKCQKICQEKMSEDMSGQKMCQKRMSEDLPENMSEDILRKDNLAQTNAKKSGYVKRADFTKKTCSPFFVETTLT